MHRSEAYDRGRCLDCGSEVSEERERAFAVTDVGVLCFACAARRGGTYDEPHDRWTRTPNLEGLPVDDAALHTWKHP